MEEDIGIKKNIFLKNIMEQNRNGLNEMIPAYEKISEIEIYPEEFEKTPKKSIKRYLYT